MNNRYNAQAQPRAAKSSLKSIGELNSKIFERSMSVPMQKVTFAFEKGDESGKITPTNPGEEPSSSSKVKKAVKAEPEKRPRSSSTVASKGKGKIFLGGILVERIIRKSKEVQGCKSVWFCKT